MGTICAPSYANILIDHFEQKYIYQLIEGESLTYFIYIDDIFLIRTRTKNELDQFFKDLNQKHPSVKFDYKASKDCIVFLDTEIYLQNGKLHTRIYSSDNPKSLKDSLPYS